MIASAAFHSSRKAMGHPHLMAFMFDAAARHATDWENISKILL
jgi:hypothetical protein